MSLNSSGGDLGDRISRFGCFGSAILVLTGLGFIVNGTIIVKGSETDFWGWGAIVSGVILVFIGGGWSLIGWIWFP